MGFFKKIFRRKKKNKNKPDEGAFLAGNVHHVNDDVKRMPPFNSKASPSAYNSFHDPQVAPSDSRSSRNSKGSRTRGSHDSSYGSSYDSRDSYNGASRAGPSRGGRPQAPAKGNGNGSSTSNSNSNSNGRFAAPAFQADFSGGFSGYNNNANNGNLQMQQNGNLQNQRPMSNGLNYDQVQQLEQQQQAQQKIDSSSSPFGQPPPKKLQLTRLPNGQLVAMDAMAGTSPLSASSDFDLSTDAEDNEYNRIRYEDNGNLGPMLGSPTSGSEDEDVALRPGLSTTDRSNSKGKNSLYLSQDESEYESFNDPAAHRSRHYFSDSDHDPGSATGFSPVSRGSINQKSPQNDQLSPQQNGSSKFTFESEYQASMSRSKSGEYDAATPRSKDGFEFEQGYQARVSPPKGISPSGQMEDGPSPRTMAIQQAQKVRNQGKVHDDMFADSADSSVSENGKRNIPHKPKSTDDVSSRSGRGASQGVIENFVDFDNNAFGSNMARSSNKTSKSVAGGTSAVSELLAQAKQRRSRASSASVNSAPDHDFRRPVPRPTTGTNSASAAAREKLQKRRKEKKEWLKSNGGASDEDSDNGQDNESWLYNEVSGALGPQGIQADLESLGERSYRSKVSTGNRSVSSRRSSHRSQTRSSSRQAKRSDESVGSRHSRGSRASRASRYSLKSTRSHLSQMSVESRSVANDLIRLEMQLAMVGANRSGENEVKKQLEMDAKRKGITGLTVNRDESSGSVGPGSISGGGRRTMQVPKRLKSSVKAPPGKLGIILANKNDAKGTVVSGVRTTSVLADKISPGDRIIAIDGEDVSRMTVTEITAIMDRKSDYARMLTVLTTPK